MNTPMPKTRVDAANGRDPQFLRETASIRLDPTWSVAGAGPGLEDRRVEITGPTDRTMAINALNSGAKVWLADQEDATSPTWTNVIGGQLTLFDQVGGCLGIEYGTIRATVLMETIQAGFRMEEIFYELRDHCAGLNAGR